MGSLGKEEDTLAMDDAAFFSSSLTTGDHRPAEVRSASCVVCVDTMACSMFSEHARAGVNASPCFPSSSKADLMPSNGYVMSASPTSSDSMPDNTSYPGTYSVYADMQSPVSPSSSSAPHTVFPYPHGALSTHVDNSVDATLPAPFSLQSVASDSGMLRHAFMCNYLSTLLPALRRIHNQTISTSFDEKLSAVKLAADMSLAVSVRSSNTWSQALLKEVEGSSACMSFLHTSKVKSRRKPARKVPRKPYLRSAVFSAMRMRARSRSIMHAWVFEKDNYVAGAEGSLLPSPAVDYLSDCSDGAVHSPNWTSVSKKVRQSWPHLLKPKKSLRRSGLSPYLRVLRSTRSKKKEQRWNKASSSTHDDASRASSPAITKEHIESLGGLVPGGRNMDVPLLLQEAADYILSLQMQVEALQSLSQFVPS